MRAGTIALLGRLPPPVRLLVLGTLVNRIGTLIVPYLSLVLARDFGLGPARAGALMTAYGVGTVFAILGGGVLTDRLGRRPTLMLSLFGSGGLAVAMGLSPSLRVFVPLLVLFGFVADLYRPAASAILADAMPSDARALGFAALRSAVNLGFAIGAAVGGFLADLSWRLLFLGDGVTTLLFGTMVWRFIAETRPSVPPAGEKDGTAPVDDSRPWRDVVFLKMCAASFVTSLVLLCFATVLPLTVTRAAGYPARVYGFLLAANGVLITLFEMPIVDALAERRRLRLAAAGVFLIGAGFGANGLGLHWGWFLTSVVLWTLGEVLSMPQTGAFVTDWAPPAQRGRYLSLFQATFSLGMALNPILCLPLHARLGDRVFWLSLPLVTLPAVALLLHLDAVADRPERLRGWTSSAIP